MFIWQVLEKHSEDGFETWFHANTPPLLEAYLNLAKPNIVWFLPEGAPPFERKETGAVTHLMSEWGVMKLFHSVGDGKDPFPNVHKYKRESKFIDTLENIPGIEADFLLAIKDKTVFDKWPKLRKP